MSGVPIKSSPAGNTRRRTAARDADPGPLPRQQSSSSVGSDVEQRAEFDDNFIQAADSNATFFVNVQRARSDPNVSRSPFPALQFPIDCCARHRNKSANRLSLR